MYVVHKQIMMQHATILIINKFISVYDFVDNSRRIPQQECVDTQSNVSTKRRDTVFTTGMDRVHL